MPAPERPKARGRVRGVVFDLDGTLVDSYGAIAESLNHARSAFALEPMSTDEVRRHVGYGLETLVADLVGADRVAEGVRLYRERYAEIFLSRTTALPGARETLVALAARGVSCAVASNKPARFSRPLLEGLGLAAGLALVAGPDTAGSTKPDPRMIHDCLRSMGVPAEQALYVGDMPLDVTSGERAGVEVVLVASGSAGFDELVRTGRPVLERLDALLDLM